MKLGSGQALFVNATKMLKEQEEPRKLSKSEELGCLQIQAEMVTLSNKLGTGTFCEVYEAQYLGTRVAVKKYDGTKEANATAYERELEILQKYRHPNIAQLIGVVDTSGT